MARRDKLLDQFRQQPADFTWNELVGLLRTFGYEVEAKGRTSGSRVRFARHGYPSINLTDRIRARSFDGISCVRYARS